MNQGSTLALGLVAFVVAASAVADAPPTGAGADPARACQSKPTAWDREVDVQPERSTSANPRRMIGIIKSRLARHELREFQGTLISLNPPGEADMGLPLEPESSAAQKADGRAWIADGTVYVYVENRKAPDVTHGVVIQLKVLTWTVPEVNSVCYGPPERYAIDVAEALQTEGVFSAKVPWAADSEHLLNRLTVIATY